MTIHLYLMRAIQNDAQRAGERDRLLLEARRAGKPRRPRPGPAAPARYLARLLFGWAAARGTGPLLPASVRAPRVRAFVSSTGPSADRQPEDGGEDPAQECIAGEHVVR